MRDVLKTAAFPVVAATTLAVAALVPGSAPARAASPPGQVIYAYAGNSGCMLYAHARSLPIQINCKTPSYWRFINGQPWAHLYRQQLQQTVAYEMQDVRTGLCINYNVKLNNFLLQTCVKGAKSELFWVALNDSSNPNLAKYCPNYWYINVGGTNDVAQSLFLTAPSLRTLTPMAGAPQGFLDLASWSPKRDSIRSYKGCYNPPPTGW
jgi:hypothetical protein